MPDLIKGKYQIVREIARSNDIVYEAIDTTFGRKIAVKELNIAPSLTGQARRDRIERFNREARAAGRLSHPNIVSVFDYGEENGRYFIAMEFLEGQSLRDALQVKGAFSVSETVQICSQLLDALSYAHSRGVVHRDIKPDNIHILPGGQAKLTDFGIARLGEEPALTSDGQVFGTPSYMSPEQIEGKSIDFRSDLFSTGVLLYELLAGRKPFTGDSVIAITYAIMNAEPAPIPGIPQGIDQVIRRALAKHPNMRHASADQMKLDLKAAETTPALFLTNQSLLPSAGAYHQQTGPPTNNPYGYHPGAAVPPSMMIYPQSGATPQASQLPSQQSGGVLPWAWNNSGSAPHAPSTIYASGPAMSVPPGSAIPPQYASSPPFPLQPPAPRPELSPAARSVLMALAAAICLGSVIGLGIIAVQNSYDKFQATVKQDSVNKQMAQGAEAYQAGDFDTAIARFSALRSSAGPSVQDNVKKNLAYSYIKRGQKYKDLGQLSDSRKDFQSALEAWPDCALAHTELSKVLSMLGDTRGANEQASAASQLDQGGGAAPGKLDLMPLSAPTGPSSSSEQLTTDRMVQARQILDEGDRLASEGDMDGAREKWQKALELAPGTEISQAANERINRQTSGN